MSDSPTAIDDIRRRAGMYVGDVHDGSGLLHVVWELVANVLDEHVQGFCHNVSVEIGEDGSVAVDDDGRGISLASMDGIPFAQMALTSLHDTPTFDGHSPHDHIGPHGVGLVAVNAVSAWLTLDVFRDGWHHRQRYGRGVPLSAPERVGPAERTGTRITFLPDPTIFSNTWLDADRVARKLRELACLVPSLPFAFTDRRTHRFHEPEGLRALLKQARYREVPVLGRLTVNGVVGQITVEAAMEWRDSSTSSIESYANVERTTDGGTHVHGLLRGLASGLRAAVKRRPRAPTAGGVRTAVRHGLHAVVCVRLHDPKLDSPTRSRLVTPEAETAVSTAVRAAFERTLEDNPALLEHLSRLARKACRAAVRRRRTGALASSAPC